MAVATPNEPKSAAAKGSARRRRKKRSAAKTKAQGAATAAAPAPSEPREDATKKTKKRPRRIARRRKAAVAAKQEAAAADAPRVESASQSVARPDTAGEAVRKPRRRRRKKATPQAGPPAATTPSAVTADRPAPRSDPLTSANRPGPTIRETARPAAVPVEPRPPEPSRRLGTWPEEPFAVGLTDEAPGLKPTPASFVVPVEPAPLAAEVEEVVRESAELQAATSSGPPVAGDGGAKTRRRRRKRKSAATATDATARRPISDTPSAAEGGGRKSGARRRKRPSARSADESKAPTLAAPTKTKPTIAGRQMIINVTGSDECRIALLHDDRLEEIFIERRSAESHVGNIYKGRITNVEPSIQAAFVDFGLPKNGFLHVSDVQPQYFPNGSKDRESVGKKVPRRERPPIQKCFRRGQEVIVQITKEGVGTKGPTLTTYLSIPGRYLVMMPGMDRLGVSRKIEDDEARRKMRGILNELALPPSMGFILRTAGLDRNKRDLQRDLNYLNRLWKNVTELIEQTSAPADLYQESDLVIRTLRDVYTSDFDRVVVDDRNTAEKAAEFLQIAAPRSTNVVEVYDKPEPIFHAYGIESQIELTHSRTVPLPSGASIVIDTTEAMVAIDVNSGRFRDVDDAEESAFKINMEAAEEIARQLRLRDLGGLIVCDFIDMRYDRHKRAVERALRDALRKHKERVRTLRMSQFGLIEITRQRQRPSIKRSIYYDCPHCRGTGLIKTAESMHLEVMRILQLAAHRPEVHRITLTASHEVALMVLNARRSGLHRLEEITGKVITIRAAESFATDQITCQCEDERGRPVDFEV